MRKTARMILSVLLLFTAACLGASSAHAEKSWNEGLSTAFSGTGTIHLVTVSPVLLPEEMQKSADNISPETFLSLSPDGKSILFGYNEHIIETVELQPGETPAPTKEPKVNSALPGRGKKKRRAEQ